MPSEEKIKSRAEKFEIIFKKFSKEETDEDGVDWDDLCKGEEDEDLELFNSDSDVENFVVETKTNTKDLLKTEEMLAKPIEDQKKMLGKMFNPSFVEKQIKNFNEQRKVAENMNLEYWYASEEKIDALKTTTDYSRISPNSTTKCVTKSSNFQSTKNTNISLSSNPNSKKPMNLPLVHQNNITINGEKVHQGQLQLVEPSNLDESTTLFLPPEVKNILNNSKQFASMSMRIRQRDYDITFQSANPGISNSSIALFKVPQVPAITNNVTKSIQKPIEYRETNKIDGLDESSEFSDDEIDLSIQRRKEQTLKGCDESVAGSSDSKTNLTIELENVDIEDEKEAKMKKVYRRVFSDTDSEVEK